MQLFLQGHSFYMLCMQPDCDYMKAVVSVSGYGVDPG